MKWSDKGIILSQRPCSESQLILSILTETHGRHNGIIRINKTGAQSSSSQPGNFVEATWNARLSEHLGRWTNEATFIPWVQLLNHPHELLALSTICALVDTCLPERHPYPTLYQDLKHFLDNLVADKVFSKSILTTSSSCSTRGSIDSRVKPENDKETFEINSNKTWQKEYVLFELKLLSKLGFGLDLSACAVTQTTHNLTYISPKTGRAVCEEVGRPYAERLFLLPRFLIDENHQPTPNDLYLALNITGYFLNHFVLEGKKLPEIRQRLLTLINDLKILKCA